MHIVKFARNLTDVTRWVMRSAPPEASVSDKLGEVKRLMEYRMSR